MPESSREARCPSCRALLFRHAETVIPRIEIKCRRCGALVDFTERQTAKEPAERPH